MKGYTNDFGAKFKEDPKGHYSKGGKKYSYVGNPTLSKFAKQHASKSKALKKAKKHVGNYDSKGKKIKWANDDMRGPI